MRILSILPHGVGSCGSKTEGCKNDNEWAKSIKPFYDMACVCMYNHTSKVRVTKNHALWNCGTNIPNYFQSLLESWILTHICSSTRALLSQFVLSWFKHFCCKICSQLSYIFCKNSKLVHIVDVDVQMDLWMWLPLLPSSTGRGL